MPVTAPAWKARLRPAARLFCAATAVRTLARTDTFMPMKPVAPDSTAPIRKPTAAYLPSRMASTISTMTPTMAIVVYWRRR